MVRVVVGVWVLFLACVQAIPRVCDTTPETIYDLELSTYEQRLLCEGSQFRDASCSSFWMRQGKLLRAKLSLELCEEFQAAPYFKYAGTPDLPEGVFFHEQVAASTITNATGQHLRDAILAEHLALRANVTSLWGDLREYMTALVDLQWADTRTNGTQEQENTRALVYSDYGKGTRDDVIASATADRAEVDAKNEDSRSHDTDEESATRSFVESQHNETRAYDTQEESTTRALVDSRNEEIRSLFDAESTNTKDTVSSAYTSDMNAFEANVEAEESTTRALVESTTAVTQNLVHSEENTTRTVISAALASEETATIEAAAQDAAQTQSHVDTEAATDRADVAAAQVEVSNTWSSLVTFVSSLADGWLYSLQNSEEATIINLLLHLNLQTGTWNLFEGDNIMNQFTSIDLFSRSDYILKLRAVANDTITYNRAAYGSDSQANNAWTQAEQKRASGNYIDAAYYYGVAYRYAVTP